MAAGDLNALNNVLGAIGLGKQGLPITSSGIVWGSNTGTDRQVRLTQETTVQGMPSLIGYGLRDAVYRLERMGLRVKATGVGHVVRQSIAPGTRVQRGMRVGLLLSSKDDKHISEEEDQTFRRMYGLPAEKKDSTQKTAESSVRESEKSEKSGTNDNPTKKTPQPSTNGKGENEKKKERKTEAAPTTKSSTANNKTPHTGSATSSTDKKKNAAAPSKKTPKGSKS